MKQNNYLLNLLKVTIFSFLLIATSPVRAEIKVVTTIKPLHSLIANVMDGVGEPSLIIEGSTSPHSFTLKPSHAKLLEEDLNLRKFLFKRLSSAAISKIVIERPAKLAKITVYTARPGVIIGDEDHFIKKLL